MPIERISLKVVTAGALLALGVFSVILSLLAGEHFRTAAMEAQTKTLSRVVAVASQEVIKQLHGYLIETNTGTQNLPKFRETIRGLLKSGPDAVPAEAVTAVLDDPFTGGLVTRRQLELSKVRVYDPQFTLVAQSGLGIEGLPSKMHPALLEKAKARKGAERLKPVSQLWVSGDRPMYSVLMPVGTFRVLGYVEWVADPVFSLRAVSKITRLPLAIYTPAMDTLWEVKDWNAQQEDRLHVGHMVRASDDTSILHLSVLEDVTKLNADMRQTEISTVTAFAALSAAVVLMALWLFNRLLFRPVRNMIGDMKRCATGDLDVWVDNRAVAEFHALADAFNVMTQKVRDNIEHERQTAEDITGKVELILEVVEQAGEGDLTGQIMVFSDRDVIARLAEGIRVMLDNLNSLVAQVQRSGIQVTSSATEIASSAKQQEAAVAEQAASTNQIMATVNEISATSKELVHTMTEVAEVAEGTAKAADEGQTALERMEATMQQMREATNSITSKLAVLNEKAGNINNVVTTVNKVADQTNLLSLNAAIEAEKAGEYGRGFAVVATEIRRLADQTAVATWDIEQMVKEMQSAVSAGVMGMEKFSEEVARSADEVRQVGGQLAHIIEQVQALTPRFESVNDGMQSQSRAAAQISESMTQLNETAQQTANSLRQSSPSITRLDEAAQGLRDGISRFKISS